MSLLSLSLSLDSLLVSALTSPHSPFSSFALTLTTAASQTMPSLLLIIKPSIDGTLVAMSGDASSYSPIELTLQPNCLLPSFVFSIRSEQWTNLSLPLPPIATTIDRWSFHWPNCFPLFLVVWSMGFRLNKVDLAFVWVEWDFGYLGWFGFLLGWMGFQVYGSIWPGELMMFGWMGWWWWRLVAWWWRLVCEREIGNEWEGCEKNNKK